MRHRKPSSRLTSRPLSRPQSAVREVELSVPGWLVLAVMATCLVPIVSYWWVWRFGYTSDHVISGLMAKSILHRGERPLFLWMLGYNGILIESYAIAAIFWLFGETPRIYYLFSTFAFIGLAYLLRVHVRPRYGALCALFTSLFFVISAPRIYFYIMRPQPNYTEIFFIGIALMHLSSRLTDAVWREQRTSDAGVIRLSIACGFLVGFGLYTYQLILFFIGSIGLWLLAPYAEDVAARRNRVAKRFLPVWRGLFAVALLGAIVLICAGSTFCLFGRSQEGRDLSLKLFRYAAMAIATGCGGEYLLARYDTLLSHWKTLGSFSLAALIGFTPSLIFTYVQHGFSRDRLRVAIDPSKIWHSLQLYMEAQLRFINAWEGPRAFIVGAIVLGSAAALVLQTLRTLFAISRRQAPKELLAKTTPLALLPFVTTGLFCLAAAAEDWESARWTIGLSMFFALAQARALTWAIARGSWIKPVAIALAVFVLSHNAAALTSALDAPDARHFHGEELVEALRAKNIRRAYGTYWYCYNIAFYTNEEIIIEPVFNNYSPHYAGEVAGSPRLAFIDDLSPRLQQFPTEVKIGGHQYKKIDSWYGKKAGFVVLERVAETPGMK